MEREWAEAGVGRLALREQLAALGRHVEPVRGRPIPTAWSPHSERLFER